MTRAIWPDEFYIEYDRLVTGELNQVRENGATSGVGVLATFGYDSFGRRTSKTFGYGAATYYTYDGVSRLTALGIDYTGTANDLSENFTYNPASQIVSVARTNDAYAWTGHTNGSTATVVNGLNQLVTVGSNVATYDAKGNLTADPITGQSFSYGPQNEFRGNSSLSLAYDALGRAADHAIGATVSNQFMFDGMQVASVYTPGTGLTERYVWGDGPDELIAWYDGAGTAGRRFAQTDERGSLLAYSDSSGNVLGINRYDEFGRPQSSNTGRFEYTGQMWLPQIAFYSYKARAYDPRSGKFPQTDPIGYDAGPNLYAYVLGDPVNLVDPLGTRFVWREVGACVGTEGDEDCGTRGYWVWEPDDIRPLYDFSSLDIADVVAGSLFTSAAASTANVDRCASRVTNDPGVGIGPFDHDPQITLGMSVVAFGKHVQGSGKSYFGGDVTTPVGVFNDVNAVTAGSFAVRTSSGGLMGYRVRVTGATGHIVGFDRGSGYRATQYMTAIWRITLPAPLSRSGRGHAQLVTAFPGC